MTSDGSVYERFRRALSSGRLLQAMAEARDIPRMALRDALEICFLLESNDDPRYERAAARWVGRFALECRRAEPHDLRRALDAFDALPDTAARQTLLGLAELGAR